VYIRFTDSASSITATAFGCSASAGTAYAQPRTGGPKTGDASPLAPVVILVALMLADLISAGYPSGSVNTLERVRRAFARCRPSDRIARLAHGRPMSLNAERQLRSNLLFAPHIGEWPEAARCCRNLTGRVSTGVAPITDLWWACDVGPAPTRLIRQSIRRYTVGATRMCDRRRRPRPQCRDHMPPSSGIAMPVTKSDASLARNAAIPDRSRATPRRPTDVRFLGDIGDLPRGGFSHSIGRVPAIIRKVSPRLFALAATRIATPIASTTAP
jgi:hypothetical protein